MLMGLGRSALAGVWGGGCGERLVVRMEVL